jgi:CBS domain-containing protein
MVKVKAIMTKELVTAKPDVTVTEACKTFASKKIGSIIVSEKDTPVGIITERDIIYKVLAQELDPKKMLLKNIMSKPLVTIGEDDDIGEAADLMTAKGIRRLGVVDKNERLVGIVTASDIRKFIGEAHRFEILRKVLWVPRAR